MNIAIENQENLSALVKVTVSESDYSEAVSKSLKTYKKKANVPGFRPGMVPMGVINKMYKKGVTAEESYRAASLGMMKDLQEKNIEFLGEPLPAESQPELDFDTQTEFEFHFEIGIAPKVELDLSTVELSNYIIEIEDKMREGYTENYLRRFGKLVDKDVVVKEEALSVTLANDELNIEDAYIGLIGMSDEERAPFIGKKVGDVMDVNVNELYKQPSQRASILAVKEEELEALNPEFTATITRIRNFEAPELNEELFKEAFPNGEITTKEQFEAMVEENLAKDLARETRFKFIEDSRKALIAAADLKLPETFLKKWLHTINEGKFTMEQIEAEFSSFGDMMSFDILKRFFTEEAKLEVTAEEAKEEAKNLAAMQFAYYGMPNVEPEMLENYAETIMGNKEEARKIYDRLAESKFIDYAASKAKINELKITAEEFGKLVNPEAAAQ